MGLLFVIEGDEQAQGMSVDIGMKCHAEIMKCAIKSDKGPFPLVRRINNYYGDILYDADELPYLIDELNLLKRDSDAAVISRLVALCEEALLKGKGIETIAD